MALAVGSLFSGIGGFDLGLERAGMVTRWQVEQDAFCLTVLARHFPNAVRHKDVKHVGKDNLAPVDVLCGGFPCQDLSVAGLRAGIEGQRSGLWSEYARLVGELRPKYVIVENVAGLLVRGGLGRVVGDLAAIGYDAEWECFPAASIGAPHLRARIWLLAYPASRRHGTPDKTFFAGRARPQFCDWWAAEPDVGRVAYGVPDGVDRRHALGNALMPQIAEWIGRQIVRDEASG